MTACIYGFFLVVKNCRRTSLNQLPVAFAEGDLECPGCFGTLARVPGLYKPCQITANSLITWRLLVETKII